MAVATIVALPLAMTAMCACAHTQEEDRKELVDFIEYCKTCRTLRQVNPAKDYTKASLSELRSAARFYEDQDDFSDCADYERQDEIDRIIGTTADK